MNTNYYNIHEALAIFSYLEQETATNEAFFLKKVCELLNDVSIDAPASLQELLSHLLDCVHSYQENIQRRILYEKYRTKLIFTPF